MTPEEVDEIRERVRADLERNELLRSRGSEMIATERRRQITQEGWSAEHDDQHNMGELARAGAVYALHAANVTRLNDATIGDGWPWPGWEFKPSDSQIGSLAKAGALIAAEIDRLLRGGE